MITHYHRPLERAHPDWVSLSRAMAPLHTRCSMILPIASVKGFDGLHPALLDLVNEKRHYEVIPIFTLATQHLSTDVGGQRIGRGGGMVLNILHATQGFEEVHVH